MKRLIGVWLVIFLLVIPSIASEKKVAFDAQAAWSYVRDLSSDSMQGRRSGQPGAVLAEEYVASKFKEWGLEPAGDNGTYFQHFTIEHRNINEGAVFEVISRNERRNFYYGDDWRVQNYSGSGHFIAEVVFAGYGIHAPEKGYDEYAGVDVKGKVVLAMSGAPAKFKKNLEEEAKDQSKIEAAQKLGALGFISFRKASDQRRYYRIRLEKETHKPDFVLLSVEEDVVNFIFEDLPQETRYLFQEIEKTAKPQSFATGVKVFASVSAIFDEKRSTRNVLAKIKGTDKNLKEETVIICAHMDHIGIDPMGNVMNGADDNASGTAVVMEIARVMKLNGSKPKRTVVFALWAGEEQGLLGSRYYVDHPHLPIEKTIACINMDMVGHGNGEVPFDGVYYSPHIWEIVKSKLSPEIMDYVRPGRGGPGGSDHTSFLMKGVPAYFVLTKGYHFKYHRRRDEIDLIKPEILKKTGDFVNEAVQILASEEGAFIEPMRQEMYYLKQQTLVNYELSPLGHVIGQHKDAKDPVVDLQFAIAEEKEGLKGDALRIDILESLLSAREKIKESKSLTPYSSPQKLSGDIRQGKATLITGLTGMNSFQDNPKWADVLAKQGISFVVLDELSFLFDAGDLNDPGKKLIDAANTSGLLLLVKSATPAQAQAILNFSKNPLVLLADSLPEENLLKLIKEKEFALGLILRKDEDSVAYFEKLDKAKKTVGTENLMMVNDFCLWGKQGQEQMLKVISELLKSHYEREDMSRLFSGTFLRLLSSARGEGESRIMPYIPF